MFSLEYEPPTDKYSTEIVSRCAPRWAWDLIDRACACDNSFVIADDDEAGALSAASVAMIHACENPED